MNRKEVFRRKETKYLISKEQYQELMKYIEKHIEKDEYYKSTICNIYFDNENNDLIIKSIDKPTYKEKVRLRSYKIPSLEDKVYLEIKRKYNGIVSKRRIYLKLKEYYDYIDTGTLPGNDIQVEKEIDYCFKRYNLKPKIYLAYDRLSYYSKEDRNFRVTFDTNIRSRKDDLRLEQGDAGKLFFKDNEYIVMETKELGAYPIWFTNALSSLKIYPQSFSKYGKIYISTKIS